MLVMTIFGHLGQ